MNTLPEQSNASATKGICFVFEDGSHTIRATGSCWTGIDRIYFDEETVVQPFKRNNRYVFFQNGHAYQVVFCRKSVSQGHLRCCLYKDGNLIGDYKSKRKKVLNFRPTYLHLAAAIGLGFASGLIETPQWFGWTFVFSSFALTLMSSLKADRFAIERVV